MWSEVSLFLIGPELIGSSTSVSLIWNHDPTSGNYANLSVRSIVNDFAACISTRPPPFCNRLFPELCMPTVIRHATAALLLEHGSDFLLRSEVENNLILGICGDMAGNPPAADKQPWLITIEQNETVIGVAIVMNPPRNIIVTRLSANARTSLVEFLLDEKLAIPGAVGPSPDVAIRMTEISKLRDASRFVLNLFGGWPTLSIHRNGLLCWP